VAAEFRWIAEPRRDRVRRAVRERQGDGLSEVGLVERGGLGEQADAWQVRHPRVRAAAGGVAGRGESAQATPLICRTHRPLSSVRVVMKFEMRRISPTVDGTPAFEDPEAGVGVSADVEPAFLRFEFTQGSSIIHGSGDVDRPGRPTHA